MPHIQIKLLDGKTEAQKEKLAAELIKAAQRVIGFGDESYSVSIEEFSWNDWKTKVYPEDIMGHKNTLYKHPGYTI